MAIEGVINEGSGLIKKSDIETTHNQFLNSPIIIAGNIKVKHPLMDCILLILGFVIDDRYFNQEYIQVNGMEVKYKNDNNNFFSDNSIIYPKMIRDNQLNHFSLYFKDNGAFNIRDKYSLTKVKKIEDKYKIYSSYYSKYDSDYTQKERFNYYLFSDLISDIPECATNESLYAVCKFREDGIFKHAIFNFHELIPIDNQ